MKKFFEDFKSFVMRGNVLNLAVGVIIGGAFQDIVKALTDNIISPLIGIFTKGNFDGLVLNVLNVTIGYGAFITAVVNFFIMAFIIFIIVKGVNSLIEIGNHGEEPASTTKECPFCKSTIHIEASICPNCTSKLEIADAAD